MVSDILEWSAFLKPHVSTFIVEQGQYRSDKRGEKHPSHAGSAILPKL
jgi:hypothetical protein